MAQSHIGPLSCGVRVIMMGKIKWKQLELRLLRKIKNQNQYYIPGGTVEIIVPIKDMNDAGLVITTASPFNSPCGL